MIGFAELFGELLPGRESRRIGRDIALGELSLAVELMSGGGELFDREGALGYNAVDAKTSGKTLGELNGADVLADRVAAGRFDGGTVGKGSGSHIEFQHRSELFAAINLAGSDHGLDSGGTGDVSAGVGQLANDGIVDGQDRAGVEADANVQRKFAELLSRGVELFVVKPLFQPFILFFAEKVRELQAEQAALACVIENAV